MVTPSARTTNDIMLLSNRRGVTLGCLLWALVIAVGAYFSVGVAEVFIRHAKFKDAMNQELRFRSKLPDYQIKNRFAFIADSLGLPEDAGIVVITRRQGRITLESHYEETLVLPGFKKEKHFEVKASGTL